MYFLVYLCFFGMFVKSFPCVLGLRITLSLLAGARWWHHRPNIANIHFKYWGTHDSSSPQNLSVFLFVNLSKKKHALCFVKSLGWGSHLVCSLEQDDGTADRRGSCYWVKLVNNREYCIPTLELSFFFYILPIYLYPLAVVQVFGPSGVRFGKIAVTLDGGGATCPPTV